jgi:hypothetical protein
LLSLLTALLLQCPGRHERGHLPVLKGIDQRAARTGDDQSTLVQDALLDRDT